MMSSVEWIVLFCAVVVAVLTTVLIFDRDYEDGLFGRIALVLLAIGSLSRAVRWIEVPENVPNDILLLWLGVTLFFARHYWRFCLWRSRGKHDWRDADATVTGGKLPHHLVK